MTKTQVSTIAALVEHAEKEPAFRREMANAGLIALLPHPHTQRIIRQSLIEGKWETTATYDVVK